LINEDPVNPSALWAPSAEPAMEKSTGISATLDTAQTTMTHVFMGPFVHIKTYVTYEIYIYIDICTLSYVYVICMLYF
jgi:hypothetical protein